MRYIGCGLQERAFNDGVVYWRVSVLFIFKKMKDNGMFVLVIE
jgi:hypothetical protein